MTKISNLIDESTASKLAALRSYLPEEKTLDQQGRKILLNSTLKRNRNKYNQ